MVRPWWRISTALCGPQRLRQAPSLVGSADEVDGAGVHWQAVREYRAALAHRADRHFQRRERQGVDRMRMDHRLDILPGTVHLAVDEDLAMSPSGASHNLAVEPDG